MSETSAGKLARIVHHSAWRRTNDTRPIPAEVPVDYKRILQTLGPGEGFVGQRFIRLYPCDDFDTADRLYNFSARLPGLRLFGSSGAGDAYAFDMRVASQPVISVPFIPLDWNYVAVVAPTVTDLLYGFSLAHSTPPATLTPSLNPLTYLKEVLERHPVILGGDPVDPTNKMTVDRETHASLVRFWNEKIDAMRALAVTSDVQKRP